MSCSIINTQSKINKALLKAAAVNATTSNVANTPVNDSAFITLSVETVKTVQRGFLLQINWRE
jgi:hypothetical protein